MGADLAHEPLSPELALVCPELAARARAALPPRDPDGFLPARRPDARVASAASPAAAVAPAPAAVSALPAWLAAVLYGLVMTAVVVVQGVAAVAAIVLALTLLAR